MSLHNIFPFGALFVAVALASISVMARREQAGYEGTSKTYRMERTLVYVCVFLALAMALTAVFFVIQARYYHGRHGSDIGVPAIIGILSAVCAYVWSIYEVRFDDAVLRIGLYARVSLPYSNIQEICEIRGQGSPRAKLVTTSGRVVNVWSNLVGFDSAMSRLRSKCPSALFRTTGPRSVKRTRSVS